MTTLSGENLRTIVGSLCPAIWKNINQSSHDWSSEECLLEELFCCVLSSQVRFELAQAVTQNIKDNGLLSPAVTQSYEKRLLAVLKSPVLVSGRRIRYRFPNVKARQLCCAMKNIYDNENSLAQIIAHKSDSSDLRDTLITLVPGLGMKQASMFLRNVSSSFDLAVIDAHVLKYMTTSNLIEASPSSISKNWYLTQEELLKRYASHFGYPVGCVDYAIWIVMRVAKRNGYL